MESIEMSKTHMILEQMSWYWKDRAKAKNSEFNLSLKYDNNEDDFLESLIPVNDHPKYKENFEDFRTNILACGWLAYNEKIIDIESKVIFPLCMNIIYGEVPGSKSRRIRWAASDALIDEGYHILMIVNAMQECKKSRNLENIVLRDFNMTREVNIAVKESCQNWKKIIIRLASSIVSEMCISGYLNLISDAKGMQPLNILISDAHKQDELVHAGIFKLFAKEIFRSLSRVQKDFFAISLAKSASWFANKELTVWHQILEQIEFPCAKEIFEDCRSQGEVDLNSVDFSGLISLSEEMGVLDTQLGRDAFSQQGII